MTEIGLKWDKLSKTGLQVAADRHARARGGQVTSDRPERAPGCFEGLEFHEMYE
jgi:hypothetical protein